MTAASIHILPWDQLVRFGIPSFRVCRRALFYNGEVIPVGTILSPEVLTTQRMKQFYEQRMLVPVDGYVKPADAARRVKKEAAGRGKPQPSSLAASGRPKPDEDEDDDQDEDTPLLNIPVAATPLVVAEEEDESPESPVVQPTRGTYVPSNKKKDRNRR